MHEKKKVIEILALLFIELVVIIDYFTLFFIFSERDLWQQFSLRHNFLACQFLWVAAKVDSNAKADHDLLSERDILRDLRAS